MLNISIRMHAAVESPRIPWTELEVFEKVGEGASGLVYRARWVRPLGDADPGPDSGKAREVAVKIFKAGTTSDGLPENEMEITAGEVLLLT